MTYESYCKQMRDLGHEPMSEQHFIEMMGMTPPVPKVRATRGSKAKEPILDLYKDEE